MKKKKVCAPSWKSLITVAILLNCCAVANSQTTAFTYQGKLTDGGAPANAIYDLEFKLFDDITGGTQVGTTLTKTNVQAVSGVFSVELDFGPEFSGADRYLEMSISLAGQGTYTTLSPRKDHQRSAFHALDKRSRGRFGDIHLQPLHNGRAYSISVGKQNRRRGPERRRCGKRR